MTTIRRISVCCLIALACASCGGGGGSDTPNNPPPSAPPPAVNRSPVLHQQPVNQRFITSHAFTFDTSLGGTAVTDPDGDTLIYAIRVTIGPTPAGITFSPPIISGTPTEAGAWEIEVQVDDGRGGNSVAYRFVLRVDPNAAPVVAHANRDQIVTVGGAVDYDATQAGTTFEDPDGDPLTYEVRLRGASGFSVSGTRIIGSLNAVGATEATLVASDAYGGSTSHAFLIAAPAPETGSPLLPATPFVYRDEDLPLPFIFRLSSESTIPLWDSQGLSGGLGERVTNAGAALGRVLFYDKRLSITNTVACASCHHQSIGFASPERFDTGVLGIPLERHTMALANARYNLNRSWFADMRARESLVNLMPEPLQNHDELGMSLDDLEAKLSATAFYPPLFASAFGTGDTTRERIAQALQEFVQSLISYRARLDLAVNPMTNGGADPASVLDPEELRGMDLYSEHCGRCHEINASTNIWQANNGLDAVPSDPGTQVPALQRDGSQGVFRAASLRNIALTAPYMHDGRFATLREVIEHYNSGIKASVNLDPLLRDVNREPRRLNLSESDKDALEAFLNTFTDDAFLHDPKFSDPFP